MPTNNEPLVLTLDRCEPLVLTVNPPYVGSAVSPTVDITETADDVTVTITDIDGEHSYTIEKTDQAISAAETAAASANSAASSATTAAENANAAASRVDSAISDAGDAAESANAAAELATAKAELADNAAALANTKAGLADVAAENANAKATLADNAASAATSAASQASSAADDAENATTAANSAAASASDAASSANAAATLASEKAELADIAATNANDKASLADTAAATANASAANADAKATVADTAANAANNAASTANEAATNANDKATLADNAATNANAKASLANAAASNADIKAGYADNAATAANTAASAANVAASAANTAATNADVKADLAELAAENADNKAALANTAASSATSAAANANAAADRVDAALETLDDDLKISDSGSGSSVLTNGCALLDVEGDGWAEQDGTPTPEYPQEVRVAKGRNLLIPRPRPSSSTSGITFTANSDGSIDIQGTATADADWVISNPDANPITVPTGNYAFSIEGLASGVKFIVSGGGFNGFPYREMTINSASTTGAVTDSTKPFSYIMLRVLSGTTVNATVYPQLESGSTATPYVPYGHVGLEIKQGSTLVECIPVPIPSDGLAALPDGTHDTLAIDSAGHVKIEKRVVSITLDGTTNTVFKDGGNAHGFAKDLGAGYPASTYLSGFYNRFKMVQKTSGNMLSGEAILNVNSSGRLYALFVYDALSTVQEANSWLANNPVYVYYPSATPTTIDLGYIDLPLMPDGCTVSIPELHEIGVEWVVTRAEAIPEMVADVRKWALHEIALAGDAELSTIAAVENATASTNYAVGSYLVHAGILYRVTTAIATGETINPGSNVTATTVMAELIRLTA